MFRPPDFCLQLCFNHQSSLVLRIKMTVDFDGFFFYHRRLQAMFILLWRLVLTPSTCHIIPGNPEMLLCEVLLCYFVS